MAAEKRPVSAGRSRLLNRLAGWLWFLAAAVVAILSLLGARPALMALMAPTDTFSSMWPVAVAQLFATQTSLNTIHFAFAWVGLIGLFAGVQMTLGFLVVRQQRGQQFNWFNWFVAFFLLFLGASAVQDILAFGIGVLMPTPISPTSTVISTLAYTSLAAFLFLFPDGRFAPRWAALGLFAYLLLWFTAPGLSPIILPIGVASLVYRYFRVATPRQRQQMKWVVWGLALFLIPSLILLIAVDHPITYFVVSLLYMFVPATIAVAMLRSHLWDVDIIIRRTLVYGTVTALLAAIYFGIVTLLTSLFSSVSGQQSPPAIVVSTLAIAALFSPLRRRVQEWIDRRFYRRKYDAQRVLERFAQTARYETDIDELTDAMTYAIQESLQPEQIVIWLRDQNEE